MSISCPSSTEHRYFIMSISKVPKICQNMSKLFSQFLTKIYIYIYITSISKLTKLVNCPHNHMHISITVTLLFGNAYG